MAPPSARPPPPPRDLRRRKCQTRLDMSPGESGPQECTAVVGTTGVGVPPALGLRCCLGVGGLAFPCPLSLCWARAPLPLPFAGPCKSEPAPLGLGLETLAGSSVGPMCPAVCTDQGPRASLWLFWLLGSFKVLKYSPVFKRPVSFGGSRFY